MRRARIVVGLLALVLLASLLPATAVLAGDASTTTLSGPLSVEEGTAVTLTATVVSTGDYAADAPTITFTATSGPGPDCTAVPVDISGTLCALGASLPVGTYTYEATYSGNSAVDASPASDPFTFEVTATPPPPPTPGPSTTSLTGPTSVPEGDDVTLTADVVANAGYQVGATITFHAISGGADCTDVVVDTSGTLCDLGSSLSAGTYTYEATYSGNDAAVSSVSPPFSFDVVAPPPPGSSTTSLSGPGTIVVGTDAVLTADVTAQAGYEVGATVDFTAVSGGGPDCSDVVVDTSGTLCDLGSGLTVGSYTYEATYSGNVDVTGSTSNQVTVVVTGVADTTVDATGVTNDVSTFYPARDSYRDKLNIKGTRNEPIAVTIKVYGPTGRRLLTKAIGLGSGAYVYAWSGRTSSGKILASGRYKVVQTLKDGSGNTLVVTKYANLSHKKLVTKTKDVTKKGLSITAASTGNILVATRSGYAKLLGSAFNPALAGYQFTIPSATRYKSISFRIYAKGPSSAPRSEIGMQDMSWCSDLSGNWSMTCFDRFKAWSSSSAAWHATSGNANIYRLGTRVRGVIYSSHGTVVVYKVRVRVVYQVLR